MHRRHFLAGGLSSFLAGHASAEQLCGYPDYNGNQICEVGIPSLRFYPSRQACEQWCWAACIQMVFATYNRFVDQRDIVLKLFGDLRCAPAPNGYAIIRAINGNWRDINGRWFSAYSEPLLDLSVEYARSDAAAAASRELAAGYPLINGAVGHATVLTAMTFQRNRWGQGAVLDLIVRDPWPENASRRRLSMQEVGGTNFLAAVRVG